MRVQEVARQVNVPLYYNRGALSIHKRPEWFICEMEEGQVEVGVMRLHVCGQEPPVIEPLPHHAIEWHEIDRGLSIVECFEDGQEQ
ncbi:MAG: hypothetical protein ACRDHP_13955 [Ktedonobacterales bacterium]